MFMSEDIKYLLDHENANDVDNCDLFVYKESSIRDIANATRYKLDMPDARWNYSSMIEMMKRIESGSLELPIPDSAIAAYYIDDKLYTNYKITNHIKDIPSDSPLLYTVNWSYSTSSPTTPSLQYQIYRDDINQAYVTYAPCNRQNIKMKGYAGISYFNDITLEMYLRNHAIPDEAITSFDGRAQYYRGVSGWDIAPWCGNYVESLSYSYEREYFYTKDSTTVFGEYEAACGERVKDMYCAYKNTRGIVTANCGPNVINMYQAYYNSRDIKTAKVGPNVQYMPYCYSNHNLQGDCYIESDNINSIYLGFGDAFPNPFNIYVRPGTLTWNTIMDLGGYEFTLGDDGDYHSKFANLTLREWR